MAIGNELTYTIKSGFAGFVDELVYEMDHFQA